MDQSSTAVQSVNRPILSSRFSNTAWALATVALFAFVFGLRVSVYNPNDGLGLLFCLPIALAAVRFGPFVGIAGGLVAFAFYAVWAHGSPHVVQGVTVYVSRLVVFLILGGFVGYYARARAELDVRSRLLFDLSPDLMGSLDLDGRVVTANDAWRSATGRITGSAPLLPDWRLELPAGQRSTAFEEMLTFADGQIRHIEWYVQRDPHRDLLYVVGRDVSERIAREAHVRELLTALQNARTTERARLASELHDFVLQQLLVALMHAERGVSKEMVNVDRFVRAAIAALRRTIDGIEPLELQHLGLAKVLDRAATTVEDEWGIDVEHDIDVVGVIDHDLTMLAYRLAGEALRNAAKHAEADNVRLIARERGGMLHLCIEDDGCGLAEDVEVKDALVPQYGTGFNLLLEQVLTNGGSSTISSVPGRGTTVRIQLPAD
jgi:signal transduction histidine kinase